MKRSDQALSLLYFLCDLVVLTIVIVAALYIGEGHFDLRHDWLNIVALNAMWVTCAAFNKVYLLHLHNSFRLRIINYLKGHFSFVGILAISYLIFNLPHYSKVIISAFILSFPVVNLIVNYILFKVLSKVRAKGANVRKALIIGAGQAGIKVFNHFEANPDFGYKIIGLLDDAPERSILKNKVIGNLQQLEEVLKTQHVDEVIIAISTVHQQKIKDIIQTANYFGIRLRLIPDYYRLIGAQNSITRFGETPIINVHEVSLDRLYLSMFKRGFDVLFSTCALLGLSPLFLFLAIAIKSESKGPVFYCPIRIGRNGKKFKLFKFRSMYAGDNATAGTQSTTKGDPRVTKIGRIIRKYSLDELPQFLNVLLGEMSVVGPRPHRVFLNNVMQKEVDNYMLRHYLKPGISGWAQVNGWRGPTDTEEQRNQRTQHDLWYVENWSPALDFKIIYRTVFSEKTYIAAF